jgi:2',3'-cyclic-nucleotide 2'-phosphodiesterase (5'-nucleotidase family)
MRPFPRLFLCLALVAGCAAPSPDPDTLTLTILGLNDVHGEMVARDDRGGLVSVSAYVAALRELRAGDGGAVLLIDAGDMWQGTLESNLDEGETVVDIYNALDVTAAAIGNHEFDFGPIGEASVPSGPYDAPRGALRQRAREMDFPLLAANLIDEATGDPVAWDNVQPSVMVEAAGVRIGIIGVMTERALQTTIAANTHGLRVAPIVPTLVDEARALRARGAEIVIVAAHAGSSCDDFSDPFDTSSCDLDGEILRVAVALPPGLVDHIVAGHRHKGIAHVVNGISINSAYSSTRAFSRTDLHLDVDGHELEGRTVYPPQPVPFTANDVYEGIPLQEDPAIVAIADEALELAMERRDTDLGVTLSAAFDLEPDVESALGNLFTEALLDSLDADIAIHNVFGGIRSGLPAGELTFGAVYEMFPFDNAVTIHELTGAELGTILARKAALHRKPGFAGMRVAVSCEPHGMKLEMRLKDGTPIGDSDTVRVIANDFLSLGGDDILTPVIKSRGLEIEQGLPRTRDVLIQWFMNHPGTLHPSDFGTHDDPRWRVPDIIPDTCHY